MHATIATEIDGHVIMAVQPEFTATARAFTYIVGELVSEPERVMALVADLNAVRDKYMVYLEQRAAGAT